jgi:hypothetical protein
MTNIHHPRPWHPTDSDLSPDLMFLHGETDHKEAAKTTIELLKRIGVECDESAVSQIHTECQNLAQLGFVGRIFPKPESIEECADPARLMSVIQGKSYDGLLRTISANDIPQMRIAIFRADQSSDADPVIHYLNMSYCHHAQGENSIYQPEAFEITKKAFESRCGYLLDIAAPDEIFAWVAMDVICGVPKDSPQFILHEGYMRPPTRFFGNYGKTGFGFYVAMFVQDGILSKQECDAANFPDIGFGGIVAFKGRRSF